MYVNDNRLITYNDIPTFVMDLLNHQAMLINTMAPVTVNVLKSALRSEATPWFSIESTTISKEEENHKEEEQKNNKSDKSEEGRHSEWKTVGRVCRMNNRRNIEPKKGIVQNRENNKYNMLKEIFDEQEKKNIMKARYMIQREREKERKRKRKREREKEKKNTNDKKEIKKIEEKFDIEMITTETLQALLRTELESWNIELKENTCTLR